MDVLTAGADIATMVTALSVVTALYIWGRNQWRDWQQQREAIRTRNWDGYIMTTGISDWYVRLIDDPKSPMSVVAIEVTDRLGGPDPAMAHNLRETIKADGMLCRVPTPTEFAFLKFLHKELGYGKGVPIR
jgi:hypothetical protein